MLFSHILHSNLSLLKAEQTVPQSVLYLDSQKICPSIFFSSQDLPQLSAYASVTVQVKTTGSSHGEMESGSIRNEEALLGKPQAKLACNSQLSAAGESVGLHFFSALCSTGFHVTELGLCLILCPRESLPYSLGFSNLFVQNICRQCTDFCVSYTEVGITLH